MNIFDIKNWFLKYPDFLMHLSEHKPIFLSRSMKNHNTILDNYNIQGQILVSILTNILKSVEYGMVFGLADHENKGDAGINWSQYMVFNYFNINIVYYCISNKIHKICDLDEAIKIANTLPKKPMIFLTGGGNMGNLWPVYENERREILEKFKDFETLIFPQSVAIGKKDTDFDYIKKHKKLTILVRDLFSYNYIANILEQDGLFEKKKDFPRLYLTPDIVTFLTVIKKDIKKKNYLTKDYDWDVIWINRQDREQKNQEKMTALDLSTNLRVKIDDWVKFSPTSYLNGILVGKKRKDTLNIRIIRSNLNKFASNKDFDDFSLGISFERFCKGLKFILQGKMVITNRLHGHIFSSLLNKTQILLDTKYSKVTNYYDTWSFSINRNYIKVASSNEDALKFAELLIKDIRIDNSTEMYLSYCQE